MKLYIHPFRDDWLQLRLWDIIKLLCRCTLRIPGSYAVTWGKRKEFQGFLKREAYLN